MYSAGSVFLCFFFFLLLRASFFECPDEFKMTNFSFLCSIFPSLSFLIPFSFFSIHCGRVRTVFLIDSSISLSITRMSSSLIFSLAVLCTGVSSCCDLTSSFSLSFIDSAWAEVELCLGRLFPFVEPLWCDSGGLLFIVLLLRFIRSNIDLHVVNDIWMLKPLPFL